MYFSQETKTIFVLTIYFWSFQNWEQKVKDSFSLSLFVYSLSFSLHLFPRKRRERGRKKRDDGDSFLYHKKNCIFGLFSNPRFGSSRQSLLIMSKKMSIAFYVSFLFSHSKQILTDFPFKCYPCSFSWHSRIFLSFILSNSIFII